MTRLATARFNNKEKGSFLRETVILMPILPMKITQISKDFDIKSKDVLDTFKNLGIENAYIDDRLDPKKCSHTNRLQNPYSISS